MGLGVQPEDLDMDQKVLFQPGETVQFVCLDTTDNISKEQIILSCKILDGQHKGRFHRIYLSKKRTAPVMIRKLREFAKAFYTEEELRSGDQPLSRLYLRRFSAVAGEHRPYKDMVFQDFGQWKDLGESKPEDVPNAAHTPSAPPPSHKADPNIPF